MVIINILIRTVSFSYDVLLSKLVGAEGIGLFQMAVSVLMLPLIITTAGIPTAVSRLVAEQSSQNNRNNVKSIFIAAVSFTLVLSAALSMLLLASAPYISSEIFKNHDMLYCIYFLCPAIVIISMTSVLRGYYYGLKRIGTASISEIIEHVSRFFIILLFLYSIYPVKPLYGAVISVCGISIGEAFDLIWLIFIQRRSVRRLTYTRTSPLKPAALLVKLFSIAAPLTMSGLFTAILQFVNAILIPARLAASGYSSSEAVIAFGRIMGMAMPLIYLPYVFTSALVINIIPDIARQLALKNHKALQNNILLSIKITLLIAIPLSAIYLFFPEQLAYLLYSDPKTAPYIAGMGYSTIFLAVQHTFSGILNGLGYSARSMLHRLAGMFMQLVLTFFLAGNPQFGVNGYFLSFFLSTLIVCLLDIPVLLKAIRPKINYSDLFLKPFTAVAFMLALIYASPIFFDRLDLADKTAFIFRFIISGLAYILILDITEAIPHKLLSKLLSINK